MYGIQLTCLTSPDEPNWRPTKPFSTRLPRVSDTVTWLVFFCCWNCTFCCVFRSQNSVYTQYMYIRVRSLCLSLSSLAKAPTRVLRVDCQSFLWVLKPVRMLACFPFFVWGKVLNTKINEYKCLWSTAWDGRCLVYYVDGRRRRRRLWQETAGIARGRSMTTVARCCCCCSCELYIAFSLIFFFKQSVAG